MDEDLFNKTCFCDLGNDSLNGIYGTTKDYVKLGWNYSEKAHKSVSHCMVNINLNHINPFLFIQPDCKKLKSMKKSTPNLAQM